MPMPLNGQYSAPIPLYFPYPLQLPVGSLSSVSTISTQPLSSNPFLSPTSHTSFSKTRKTKKTTKKVPKKEPNAVDDLSSISSIDVASNTNTHPNLIVRNKIILNHTRMLRHMIHFQKALNDQEYYHYKQYTTLENSLEVF